MENKQEFTKVETNLTVVVSFKESLKKSYLNELKEFTLGRVSKNVYDFESKIVLQPDDVSKVVLMNPENDFHPEDQLLIGSVIVDFAILGKQIVVLTNSPYILNSIETHSRLKNLILNACLLDIDGSCLDGPDVMDKIYRGFSKPFQRLKDLESGF